MSNNWIELLQVDSVPEDPDTFDSLLLLLFWFILKPTVHPQAALLQFFLYPPTIVKLPNRMLCYRGAIK